MIRADLEITVQLLVQIDKLVQLIESPVFTRETKLTLGRRVLNTNIAFQRCGFNSWNRRGILTSSNVSTAF